MRSVVQLVSWTLLVVGIVAMLNGATFFQPAPLEADPQSVRLAGLQLITWMGVGLLCVATWAVLNALLLIECRLHVPVHEAAPSPAGDEPQAGIVLRESWQ